MFKVFIVNDDSFVYLLCIPFRLFNIHLSLADKKQNFILHLWKMGPLYFAERSAGSAGTLCFRLKTHLYASYQIDTLCIV